MLLRHAGGTAHPSSLSKWWGDDNEDVMQGGEERGGGGGGGVYVSKNMSHILGFYFILYAIVYFCSEIKLRFSIIEAGAMYQSNAISPCAPAVICAAEKVRVMHNILSDWLLNIILNDAMQFACRTQWL